ncbi:hypothetical protein [Hyphomicrobium sp.]|uniref:hypothetical protein n=1 Tax=Hyphomicrobium sp. TaxID=82 RepID=UPI000FB970D6|nr:hypothetical protein [Hyphomicrobium sp.]RUO99853.1 MAG: hypothetical protein EKK30_05220 [Hyphomicrobium sp.]
MGNRLLQRWLVVLGMVAMFGALISMPLASTYALAMAGAKTTATTMSEMPCHNPAKHCPDCPQKVCPEMGNCLVKSFQPLPQPIAEARLQRDVIGKRMMPTLSSVTASFLTPPLLRPPIV